MKPIFFKKGNLIFSIKLGQKLPKSFSQLHVKNSRFFLSYFLKKDDWPKTYAGPRLPTLPYVEHPQIDNQIDCRPKCPYRSLCVLLFNYRVCYRMSKIGLLRRIFNFFTAESIFSQKDGKKMAAMDDTSIEITFIFYLITMVTFNQKSFKIKYHT